MFEISKVSMIGSSSPLNNALKIGNLKLNSGKNSSLSISLIDSSFQMIKSVLDVSSIDI